MSKSYRKVGAAAQQHEFDFARQCIPERVAGCGLGDAHHRPLVGRRTPAGFWSGRVPPDRAWVYEYLEFARTGSSHVALVLDCDDVHCLREGALLRLPPVSWAVWHGQGGCHAVWCLSEPVHRYPRARLAPLQLLARIEAYYLGVVRADSGFAGVLGDNPVAPDEGRTTRWGATQPYSLRELAEVVPLGWKRPRASVGAIGRNVDLFRDLMRWAGEFRHVDLPVLPAAHMRNQEFEVPLPLSEIASTARSVERYRREWVARGWHRPSWVDRQAERGRRSGAVRRARTRKRDAGIVRSVMSGASMRGVAREHGLNKDAVRHIVARDAPLFGGDQRTNTDRGPGGGE